MTPFIRLAASADADAAVNLYLASRKAFLYHNLSAHSWSEVRDRIRETLVAAAAPGWRSIASSLSVGSSNEKTAVSQPAPISSAPS